MSDQQGDANAIFSVARPLQPLITFAGAIPQLFPVSDERSLWMLRLAVLREDLQYEVGTLGWDEEGEFDPRADAWRITYQIRKISITVNEIAGVLAYAAAQSVKREPHRYPDGFSKALALANQHLLEASEFLKPIRNAGGGHVRLESAEAHAEVKALLPDGESLLHAVQRNLPNFKVSVEFDTDPDTAGRRTNLQEVGTAYLHMMWPDVDSDEAYDAKHRELQTRVFPGIRAAIPTIDGLLAAFWSEKGLRVSPSV